MGRKRIYNFSKEKHSVYYWKNVDMLREKNKEIARRRREVVINFYGGNPPKCSCCGEGEVKFLTIDHINGGGRDQRKKLWPSGAGGGNLMSWIVKNDFPDIFQVLCYNCNCSKGCWGKCPHKQI